MKVFRFGYADGYISPAYKISEDKLTLIGTRRGLERPIKIITNFSKDTKLTEVEDENLYFAKAALHVQNQGVIYED